MTNQLLHCEYMNYCILKYLQYTDVNKVFGQSVQYFAHTAKTWPGLFVWLDNKIEIRNAKKKNIYRIFRTKSPTSQKNV